MSIDASRGVSFVASGAAAAAAAAGGQSAAGESSSVDSAVTVVRARVLQTIRTRMPLAPLFTPALHIDLGLFLRDQMLMRRIAEHLAPLVGVEGTDSSLVARHFAGSALVEQISGMFRGDSGPYLQLFYQACADALTGVQVPPDSLRRAIEGRVHTTKNALVAAHTPEAIRLSQERLQLAAQEHAIIREEGRCFLRQALQIHLAALAPRGSSSFRDELVATATQLVPFVSRVTVLYLRENGKSCPDNPLCFRNPTGYNHHGLVAATVMEVCLNALGYGSALLGRSDIEPRVANITHHNVIMVSDSEGKRYIVDPSYRQFHRGFCLERDRIPPEPVLVLEANEVDAYVETHFMEPWRRLRAQIEAGNPALKGKLYAEGKHLLVAIDRAGLGEMTPPDVVAWVERAVRRLWDLSSYMPIASDRTLQELFYGLGNRRVTYTMVAPMGLTDVTNHLSYGEVESKLEVLLTDPSRGKNSSEVLHLLAGFPRCARPRYHSLFHYDPRLLSGASMVDIGIALYWLLLRTQVNPQGRDLRVVYGCSGADATSVLHATDANDLTFVDLTNVTCEEVERALELFRGSEELYPTPAVQAALEQDDFVGWRSRSGAAKSIYLGEDKHQMNNLALKFIFDLRAIGVDLNSVRVSSVEDGGVQVEFSWQYHGDPVSRRRRVLFVRADITQPEEYPGLLRAVLEQGVDAMYMKAAYLAPRFYERFAPYIGRHIRPGGWLLTGDRDVSMDIYDPTPSLAASGLTFVQKRIAEVEACKSLFRSGWDALAPIPLLDQAQSDLRTRRPLCGPAYWTEVSLRQKE